VIRTVFGIGLSLGACNGTQQTPCRDGTVRGQNDQCEVVTEEDSPPASGFSPSTDTAELVIEIPAPSWDQASLEAALLEAFGDTAPTTGPLHSLWRSMFVGRDAGCPGSGYNIEVPMTGCHTSSGWRYTGPATYDTLSDEGIEAILLNADSHITTADGDTFYAVGMVVSGNILTDVGVDWDVEFRGMWKFAPSEVPWIAQGISLSLAGTGTNNGATVGLSGGWSSENGAITMHISQNMVCPSLSGTVWMKDPSGPWHSLALDCASCGTWTWENGEVLGSACVDEEAFAAWAAALGET